jgi:hypothetical protein
MIPNDPGHLSARIRAAGRRELDEALDQAVENAIAEARRLRLRRGILISHHDHRTVTVELTDSVEQGTIREQDLRAARIPDIRA